MHFTFLIILSLVPLVLADDWDDFTNNLATDLAPLITLFGERLTKQFLSESISLIDNFIFALSPLGVLTTVVSVIRVCGGSSLRAFIGRAQEGPAEAESELLPCVSESTAELFNDGGISRVFGRPRVLEIVAWENEDPQSGERSVKFGTLLDAITKGAWSIKGTGHSLEDWCQMAEVHIPNLSLNKGIKRRKKIWFYCTAVLGSALQIGVVVYAIITVFIFPSDFKKDGNAVPSYAFPFFIVGSAFLFIGMFSSAVIIERSSKEYIVTPKKPSKLYWLQPGNQNVGDQVFGAFMAVKEGANSTMTKKLRYIKSVRDRRLEGKNIKIYLTILSTMFGFIIQFIGLRALHASVILASLGATLLMSILRTCLRTERMAPDENKLKDDREMTSPKKQELDCFAFYLDAVDSFGLVTVDESPPTDSSNGQSVEAGDQIIERLIKTRTQLAKFTSKSETSSTIAWEDLPIRAVAHGLARTIEATMDMLSSWGIDFGETFKFPITFECQLASSKWAVPLRGTYTICLRKFGNPLRWHIDNHELESMIGLWTWSLYKKDDSWRRPLSRLIGLSEAEAGRKETFLYFHKWIFRQKEAKMISTKMIDSSRRLFGYELGQQALDGDILAIDTDNDLETMIAQDIYIHFLQSALDGVDDLGGDVDVTPGIQGSYVLQDSHINELMYAFERYNLGSFQDALLSIVPVLRQQNLLQELGADAAGIRKRIEEAINDNDWASALGIAFWISGWSEGLELQHSLYELGYLCRRALLSKDSKAQELGSVFVKILYQSDARTTHMKTKRIAMPTSWSEPPAYERWSQSFSRQLGWVAWHIHAHAPSLAREAVCSLIRNDSFEDHLHGLPLCFGSPTRPDPNVEGDSDLAARYMLEWLIDENVNVDNDFTGEEIFQWALEKDYHALLYFVLLRWVEIGEKYPNVIQLAYTTTAKSHSCWGIRILQRRGANIDTMNDNNISALMEVTAIGDINAVQVLLEAGANPSGDDEVRDARPLSMAAYEGRTDIVELLLQYGAKLEALDNMGHSALHWARKAHRLDVVRLLLARGATVDISDLNYETALHSAVTEGQLEMCQLLLAHGANINKPDGRFGYTPLTMAARASPADMLCPQMDMIRMLLSNGADALFQDQDGLTARDWAMRRGSEDIAAILEVAMHGSVP